MEERSYFSHAKSSYGTDIYGEAVLKARANAKIAGMPIHFINRDFMEFKHEYLFDEIITDCLMWDSGLRQMQKKYTGIF